jgi:hypothetical protein
LLFLDGVLNGLDLVIRVDINREGLCSELDLDGDRVEIGNNSGASSNAGISNCLGILEGYTSFD